MNEIATAQRGGPLTVAVLSMMAAATGAPHGFLWSGEIPVEWLPPNAAAADFEAVNESLFRYFNRVEEDDARRLEAIGYLLPSLRLGDLVGYGDRVFRIAAFGFEPMPGRTMLETVALALSQLRGDSRSPASGSDPPLQLGTAVARPSIPTDAQGGRAGPTDARTACDPGDRGGRRRSPRLRRACERYASRRQRISGRRQSRGRGVHQPAPKGAGSRPRAGRQRS
jgi:hypothetical protein